MEAQYRTSTRPQHFGDSCISFSLTKLQYAPTSAVIEHGVHESSSLKSFPSSTLSSIEMSRHGFQSLGSIPFSWENQPGISKVTSQPPSLTTAKKASKLPPPPCPPNARRRISGGGLGIPLPPSLFQQPRARRSSPSKGLGEDDDPFLAALLECTKSVRGGGKTARGRKREGWIGFRKMGLGLSCKQVCGVREDGMVKLKGGP